MSASLKTPGGTSRRWQQNKQENCCCQPCSECLKLPQVPPAPPGAPQLLCASSAPPGAPNSSMPRGWWGAGSPWDPVSPPALLGCPLPCVRMPRDWPVGQRWCWCQGEESHCSAAISGLRGAARPPSCSSRSHWNMEASSGEEARQSQGACLPGALSSACPHPAAGS